MGRHRHHDRPTVKKIMLPESVVQGVDLALRDPLSQKPRYGMWGEVVSALLEKWMKGEVRIHISPYRLDLTESNNEG